MREDSTPTAARPGGTCVSRLWRLQLQITFLLTTSAAALPPDCGSTVDECLSYCPTAAEVAAIDDRLDLIFEADPSAAGGLVCTAAGGSADLTWVQERAYQALLMFERLSFDQPFPWTEKSLAGWLYEETAIRGIRFRDDITFSFCCDPPDYLNLRVQGFNQPTPRWVNPQSGTGVDGLVLLIVHEARHNQGFPHTCGSNDDTVAQLGAWGVQYHLRNWLAYHSDPCFLVAPDPWPTYYLEISAGAAWFLLNSRFCFESPDGPIEDLDPVPECVSFIFADGFESGDLAAWSTGIN